MKPVFIICDSSKEVTMSVEEFKKYIDEAYSSGFEDGRLNYFNDVDSMVEDIFEGIEDDFS